MWWKRLLLALIVALVTIVGTVSFSSHAADPTLRDFPDTYESKITDPKTGWGGKNLRYLGGMLDALYDEVQDAHRRVSCLGGLDVADRSALAALVKADLATALADSDCTVLYATVTDDGAGTPRRYRYNSASTATASNNIVATGEGGAGRWIAVGGDLYSGAFQSVLAAEADRVAGDDSGATAGSGLEFATKYTLTTANLAVGQSFRVRAGVHVVGQNGTDDLTLTLFVGGTSGVDLAVVAAYDAADDDVHTFDVTFTVTALGATGKVFLTGNAISDKSGTLSIAPSNLLDETTDWTSDPTISVAALWGSSSATNEVDLLYLEVTPIPAF